MPEKDNFTLICLNQNQNIVINYENSKKALKGISEHYGRIEGKEQTNKQLDEMFRNDRN